MRRIARAAVVGSALLAAAAPAAAQAPGIELVLNPRVGLFVPVTDLAEVTVGGSTTTVGLGSSLALGLGAELQLVAIPFGIRANLDYATGSQVTAQVDGTEFEGEKTTLLALAADLVFRPLPDIIMLQPYLFAGGGLKQYDPESAEDFEAESDPTLHLGFGVDLGFGPLSLNAELGDYISWFENEFNAESKMQHDLFLGVGFAIGLL